MQALILRGSIARYQKNFRAAEEYCQKVLLLKPNLFNPKNDLALALVEQNDEEKKQRALDYAETNVQKYGKSAEASEAYSTYGWVLYKMDRIDDAERFLRTAISGACTAPIRRTSTPACWPNVAGTPKTPSNCSPWRLKTLAVRLSGRREAVAGRTEEIRIATFRGCFGHGHATNLRGHAFAHQGPITGIVFPATSSAPSQW